MGNKSRNLVFASTIGTLIFYEVSAVVSQLLPLKKENKLPLVSEYVEKVPTPGKIMIIGVISALLTDHWIIRKLP